MSRFDEAYDEEEEVGFKFNPSAEELILSYLLPKVQKRANEYFELEDKDDIYTKEPWKLHKTETDFFEPKEWYYFVKRTQLSSKAKGKRPKRKVEGETCKGCWKATGKSKNVVSEQTGQVIGKEISLSFYVINGEKEEPTGWIMIEYSLLSDSFQTQVLCHLKEP